MLFSMDYKGFQRVLFDLCHSFKKENWSDCQQMYNNDINEVDLEIENQNQGKEESAKYYLLSIMLK